MNINELIKSGGILSNTFDKKTVEWAHESGSVFIDVFVKKPSAADVEFCAKVDVSFSSAMIHRCVRFGDAQEQMTLEQAQNLEPQLFKALNEAVFIDAKKNSSQRMNSGASLSSTALAGKPSRKRKKQ